MTTQSYPFLIQGKNIIIVIDGKSYTINKNTHPSFDTIMSAIKVGEWDKVRELVEPKKFMVTYGAGMVEIQGEEVWFNGKPMHNALSTRLIEMAKEGFPIEPMVRFMDNLMKNPSKTSVDQLYGFLEKNSLPITEDGHFLAYKKVRKDFLDIHSGTIKNTVGSVIEMPRNEVDDNAGRTCSSGLHFCSISYLSHFGSSDDPIMILKINPADVVSIPSDYNGAKGRCCKYEVVAQVQGNPADAFSKVVEKVAADVENTEEQTDVTYRVFRVKDDVTVATGCLEDEADLLIQRAKANKKATLAKEQE